jgi:hypothetical protein
MLAKVSGIRNSVAGPRHHSPLRDGPVGVRCAQPSCGFVYSRSWPVEPHDAGGTARCSSAGWPGITSNVDNYHHAPNIQKERQQK